jgi:Spy/CpxP family protein refolding chaperone
MPHGSDCPCEAGAHHDREPWEHGQDADGERTARRTHRGGRNMPGWGHRGPGRGAGPGEGQDVMRELASLGVRFYSPPVLLRHAQKVGLTPDQVTKIRQEVLTTQTHTVDLFAKARHAEIDLVRLLSAEKIDEHAVLAQIDEAARAKAEVHKLHLEAMLRVRALLTPEQLQKLKEHKSKHESPKPAAGAAEQKSGALGEADDDADDDGDGDEDDADGSE